MWQRFTERARRVIFYAQEEAKRFGEGYVDTEHMLLGLVRETDGVAAHVLEKLGISLDTIRSEVEKQLPRGDAAPNPDMTLTPRAKRVIDLAYNEARRLGDHQIGTEHLLLGLICERESVAGRVFAKVGVGVEDARREIIALRASGAERAILYAKQETSSMGWRTVTPQFLLLGLLQDESDAAVILQKLGVDLKAVRRDLVGGIGEEPSGKSEGFLRRVANQLASGSFGREPSPELSDSCKRAHNLAYDEAHDLSTTHVSSAHLLLGLLRESEDIAKLLGKHGVTVDAVRELARSIESQQEPSRIRFAESTRKAVFGALEESNTLQQDDVSPECLLLGLMREDNAANQILRNLEADVEGLWNRVLSELPPGASEGLGDKHLSLSAKQAVDFAYQEAKALGHDYVGAEHLLLGLLGLQDDRVVQILNDFNVTLDGVREQVRLLGG